ncbi:MAG TPA: ATP-binding protein [Stellaceae bacterium]|nr:ATP-binding protein [Stellaceae bacterium]
MRVLLGLGGTAAALLLPVPAYAFDATAVVLPPVLVVIAAVAVAVVALQRLTRRLARAEGEGARLAEAYAESAALLKGVPAALYAARATGGESFDPGPIAAFAGIRDFAGVRAALAPKSREALDRAVARLKTVGAPFILAARLAGSGAPLEVVGRRVASAEGAPTADLVWFLDGATRAAAEREQDGLRRVLDALALPVWRRDKDLKLIDCNRAYAAAVDAQPERAVAEGREIAAGAIGEGGRALAGLARDQGAAQTESHHIVIGGSRRLVEITESPLAGSDEIVGWARDVTDRESAEGELARHIAAHAEVLENAMVAIAIYGPDTRVSFFNTAFARLWHLEEDWLQTEPTLDEVLERLRERRRLPEYVDFRAFKEQQRAMFTSLIEPQEELLHLPDERTVRLLVSPHPFGGLTFAYEDVTDKLALERSYNTLIEVQRATLDHLYEAVAVFGSDGRLKLSNPAYGQMWLLAPEDLAGEPHVAEIAEKTRVFFDDGANWPEQKRRIIARLMSHAAASTRLERRDGSILQAATVPLPDGNVLLSYLDVTDSTRVEHALLERNEALETADRLKSEFIANVSYELRTPLNATLGFAEILANQYFGALNPRQLEHARGIIESSNQLLSLINDILDLATIEAGYMQIETHAVDVHAMMASVVTLSRERARSQGIKLDFDCPPDIGTILADERRLKQALFNLTSNALKFTPAGGTVTLAARREGDQLKLIVADTGVGVAEEDQARIFGKFERGHPQMRQAGAGLGLSLVKSFIELHGGRVELESAPGSGTTVTCILDLDTAEEAPALRSA